MRPSTSVLSRRSLIGVSALALSLLGSPRSADAQGAGFQEYYVIGRESHVYNMMERVATAQGGALGTNSTHSVVSMVAASNGQRIFYDQWEDGLDTGLNSSTPGFPNPVQASIGAAIAGTIARVGTTVTVTSAGHGYATGNLITIAGAAPPGYNGAFKITVLTANTFSYQVPAALGGITTAAMTSIRTSTMVLGDGNLANGRACDFTNDPRVFPCNGTAAHDDALFDGTAVTLDSPTVALPRVATAVHWDGGDRIVSSGGPLSLIHNQDPQSNFIGGSVEVLSRQAYANATSYSIPAGEDLYTVSNTLYYNFHYVDIDIVAFQDNTNVTITSPGAGGGTISFTLNQGQHYTNRGCSVPNPTCAFGQIDDVANSAPFIRINSGTKIATTGPLAGMIHGGGDGNYSTDIFPILPDLLHGNDYLIPSLGDDAAVNGNRPMNLYLFNPDPVNAITITATDSAGSRTFNVNPNTTVNYFNGAAPNRYVPANSTVRLTSSANFWGLAVHDSQSPNNDWGYAFLATKFLTSTYTVAYSPGVRDPATQYAARVAACRGGTPLGSDGLGSALNPGACDTFNRSPIWIGATADGTRVKVDFNGDGLFDYIDVNSDDFPDDGAFNDGTCAPAVNRPGALQDLNNCVYSINALQALRVYDWTDYDNTGTQIVANKPISVVYGQDTDQATGGDPIQDTGYTIYPTLQAFLDPVLTVAKTASPASVSGLTGGVVTFSLTVKSYLFGGLTGVTVFDDLPASLTCVALAGNYVTNSSRITYPNLSQQVGDAATGAACTVGGGAGGRDRLTWTLSPNTLGASQTLTIDFQVSIPTGAATSFINDVTARANLGSSVFEATAQATVVRTNVTFTKSVVDDNGGQPEFGDSLTYTLVVTNNGALPETGITISDAIPASTVFLGPVTGTAPFTGAFSAAQNSVVWTNTGGPFAAAATATLTFKVTINSGNPAAGAILNFANYSSAQTPSLDSNTVSTSVVSPALEQSKTGPSLLVPGEVATFEILVRNTGAGSATNVRVRDPLSASNMTYVANSMQWSLNGGAFTSLLDGANNDPAPGEGTLLAGPILELLFDTLGPGGELRFRFQATVNAGTGGLFATNQATVSATQVQSRDTNLLQIPIANATVTGHLFLDLDGNGVQNGAEQNLPNVTVVLLAAGGQTRTLVTDASGNYSGVMPAGSVTATVDGADPDIPPGSTLTTAVGCVTPGTAPCNDIQTVTAIANATVATTNVGYQPPPLQITKVSNAGGTVVPGQTITYTVTVTNNTPTTQTSVTLNDVVPSNTAYVNNSAQVTYPTGSAIRVTEYYIDNAAPDQCSQAGTDFATGNTACTLTLNQNLSPNYFVIVQGSESTVDSTPGSDYVALTNDGYGTGDFVGGIGLNQITLTRGLSATAWLGVVTVVECIAPSCATDASGFQLLDVKRITFAAAAGAASGTVALNAPAQWTAGTLPRVMLVGGANGSGCDTASATILEHHACHPRLFPSGTSTINWARDAGGAAVLDAANTTVMAVLWGSGWTVQRAAILNGNLGGDSINAAVEYNTVAINPVARARTWVWGTGTTATANTGTGDSPEGVALTLGDGLFDQNPPGTGITHAAWMALNASTIAAGIDVANTGINFDVYALTHPQLSVDYRFLAEGNAGIATVNQAVNTATANRMALVTNDFDEHNNDYPKPILSARYTSNTNVQIERRRTGGGAWAAWLQGIDFSAVLGAQTVVCGNAFPPAANQCTQPSINANVVHPNAGFTIPSGASLTLTFQVTVDNPLSLSVTQISNTAGVTTLEQPGLRTATATDNVLQPGVKVEPNNAGFAAVPTTPAGTQILFTQGVTNRGTGTDSFTVTLDSDLLGWKLELINPATGAVLATDTNGDGIWDGGAIVSTGSLAAGATRQYTIRATVPFGTSAGTQNSVEFTATSALSATVKDVGTNEITVLPGAIFGPVVLIPDHSGIVTAGETIAYTHRIFNNTGAAETFDLTADVTLGWPTTIHADTNGDGVYTPGVDLAVANTAQLPNGGSQILFVVTTAPALTPAGTDEVVHITARSRSNPVQVDAVTDTTTILAASTHDLSGGGTRMAGAGDTTTFPGTLYNLSGSADRYDFSVTASSLFGVDGLNHPTVLRVDTDSNGIPDTTIAVDSNGDGVWDQLCGAPLGCSAATYNNNANGLPDIPVAANGSVAYELVRTIDPSQKIWKEYATLTSTAFSTSEKDSITAQWIIAALSRASIRGLRVDPAGIVEFVTGTQQNTAFFNLYETADRSRDGERTLLNATPVISPAPDSLLPIIYRVQTGPVNGPYLLIEETETTGNVLVYGPYSIVNTRLRRGLERVEAQMDRFGVPAGSVRVSRRSLDRVPGAPDRNLAARRRFAIEQMDATLLGAPASAPRGLLIEVVGDGEVAVPIHLLQQKGFPSPPPAAASLRLSRAGVAVPLNVRTVEGTLSLVFRAEALATDYTDRNAYVLGWPGTGAVARPTVSLTRSADPSRTGYTRIERNSTYAATVPDGADPWQWDLLFGDGTAWPYPYWGDPTLGQFDLPNLVAQGPATSSVVIRLVGVSDYRHEVRATLNGFEVGSIVFAGRTAALLQGSIPQSLLRASGNELALVYSAQNEDGSPAPAGYVYLDYLDVAAPMPPSPGTAVLAGIRPYNPVLPARSATRYLIVTHSAFRAQAQRLADLKTAERLRAQVVDVESAYDSFSGGVREPRAIAAAIREFGRVAPQLQYVVLAGDDALDPRNFLGGSSETFIPSIMGRDGVSRVPNENAYADLNDDGSPDLAIGRLPVTTIEEATAVVDKIEAQSATLAASGNVHVFVSDDSREVDSPFSENAREMAALLPDSSTSVMAEVGSGVGLARSALFGSWHAGTTMTHYFGHGGPEIWTDEALFSVDDVPDLQGTMSPMVLFAWACQSQFYQNYYGPSVNEALFLVPQGGALASFGPVGITSPAHQRQVFERVYAQLYQDGLSLGEIIRRAKVAALAADPQNRDAVEGFMFFGDPSLRIPRP